MKKYLLILTAILLSVVTGCKQTENDKKLSIELSLDQESVTATGAVINVKQENATKGAYLLTNDLQATITIEDVFAKGTELKSSDTKINLNGLKANTDYKVVAAISAEGQQLLSNEVTFKTLELPADAPVIKFKQLEVTENFALIEVTTEKTTKAFILCEPKGMTANADEEYIRKHGDEIPSEELNKSFEAKFEALSSETTYVIYSVVENESIAIVGETFEFTTSEEISSEEPSIKFELVEVTNSTVEYKVITKNVTSVKLYTRGAEESAPSEAIIDAAGTAIPSEYLNATYTVSLDELEAETEYAVYALVKGENDKFVSNPFKYKTLANSAGGDINVTLTTATANVSTDKTHTSFFTVFKNSDESKKLIIVFRAENGSTYLPAGTYSLSEEAVSGTLDGSRSSYIQYLEEGSDVYTYTEATAEVTVNNETGIYNITLNGKLNDGKSIKATYEGEVTGMYFGGSNSYEHEASSVGSYIYSVNNGAGTNVDLNLYSTEDQSYPYAKVSFYIEGRVKYIPAGKYSIAGAEYGNVNAIESKYYPNADLAIAFKEGTVDVQLEDKVYTITVDATLASNEPLKFTYTGEIEEFTIPGPAETIEVTFVKATKNHFVGREYEVELSDETKNHRIVFDFNWKEGDHVPAGSWSTDNTLDYWLMNSYCGYYGSDNKKQSFSKIELTTEIKNGKYEVNFTVTTETNLTIIGTYVGDFPGITLPNDGGGDVEKDIKYVNTTSEPYGKGEILIKFTDESEQNPLELFFYWFSDETYLPKGEYSFANNYLDKNSCLFNGLGLQDAVVNVDIVDGEYVIDMAFTTNAGVQKKGTFKGQIDGITLPDDGSGDIEVTLSTAEADVNTKETHTSFYTVFKNSDESEQVIISFRAENGSTYLPAGTYTLSENAVSGTLELSSYEVGSDVYTCSEATAEVTVDTETHIYNITLHGKLNDGTSINATYVGEITGMYFGGNTYEYVAPSELAWSSLVNNGDGTKVNLRLFQNENQGYPYAQMSFYVEGDVNYIPAATYNIAGAEYGSVNASESSFYVNENIALAFKEGTVDVQLEDKDYTITVNATLATDEPLNITYTGKITEFTIPEEGGDAVVFTKAECYPWTESNYTSFSVALRNDNDNRLDIAFYGSASDEVIASGTYVVESGAYEAGKINAGNSYYYESENACQRSNFTSGKVTVSLNEETHVYTIAVEAELANGNSISAVYEGEIDGLYFYPADEPDHYQFAAQAAIGSYQDWYSDRTPVTIQLYENPYNENDWNANLPYVSLELNTVAGATHLLPGTYNLTNNSGVIGEGLLSSCRFYNRDNHDVNFSEGTLEVAIEENREYTLSLTGRLTNGRTLAITYSGAVSGLLVPGPAITTEVTFDNILVNVSNGYQFDVTLTTNDGVHKVELGMYDLNSSSDNVQLHPGFYDFEVFDGTQGTDYISGWASGYYYNGGEKESFKKGVGGVTVSKDGKNYTFEIELTVTDNETIKGTYTGKLTGIDDDEEEEGVIKYVNAEKYNLNGGGSYETYIMFTDERGENLLELSFKYDGGLSLTKGEYTFANDDFYKNRCYFDQTVMFKDAVVNVDIVNGEYVIDMAFTTTAGVQMKCKFKGQITVRS